MKTKSTKPHTARSLTTTLAIAFLALSAAILLISGVLQALSNLATQQEAVAGKLQLFAREASQPVSSFIQTKFNILETAARLTNPVKMAPTEQQQVLESLLGRDVAFRQVVALNAQDQEVAKAARLSQQAAGTLADQLQGEMLTQVRQGKQAISAVRVDPNTSEPLVLLALPVTNALGEFQGTLAAEVNLKFMWDLIDQLQVGETGVAYVVDKQGDLIAFNDTARVLQGENVANLTEVHEFTTNPESIDQTPGELTTGIRGTTVVATYAPLGTPDWAVVVELPWEEAYREVIQNLITSVVILLTMAGLAGLLGIFLARRLAVPLVSLTDTATRITEGEIELQAAVGGPSEVARLAASFNSMTAQLRSLISGLEQHVAERTAELTRRSQELEKSNLQLATTTQQAQRRAALLTASAQVARVISQVRDLDQLLPEVTRVISQAFGYYHVGVFTVDEVGRFAVLRAANSEGGQRMLARGHRLSIGKEGIVGYVTGTGKPRIALDVGSDAVHFDNPDLPQTRSELALPLSVRGQTFGALDVQSIQETAFSEEDVAVLSTLADQIVIAIENARLFAEAQTALQAAEETTKRYLRQEWGRLVSTRQTTSHEYHISGVPPAGNAPLPEIEQAVRQGEVVITSGDNASPARTALAVPIKLRDQVVGVIDLHETDDERRWSEDDIAVLTAVADQAALALENARLFEESERLAYRERTINEINSRVRQTIDLDAILKTAVKELGQSLKAARVVAQINVAPGSATDDSKPDGGNGKGSDHA
jgi:GAF domain-containing protein/HAMP domain-containing protein